MKIHFTDITLEKKDIVDLMRKKGNIKYKRNN